MSKRHSLAGVALLLVALLPALHAATVVGDREEMKFAYDGKQVVIYNVHGKAWSSVDAPASIDQAMDMLANQYGMALPLVDLVVAVAVVLFTGLYLASEPRPYLRGALRLVPPEHRRRAAEALYAIGHVLRWWLMGQGLAMLVVGLAMGIGLGLLGVQLSFLLGVLAGLTGSLFGTVSANRRAYFAMGNLLLLAALAMLDVFPVAAPARLVAWASKFGGRSPAAVFLMGATSGLVAAPCGAPAFAAVLDRWIFKLETFELGPWTIKLFPQGSAPVDTINLDRLSLFGLAALAPGRPVDCLVRHADGTTATLRLAHTFAASQLDWFRAGSALNVVDKR